MRIFSTPFFATGAEALTLGAMTVLLPLSPLMCTVLSGRLSYLLQYRSSLARSAQCVKALRRTRVISRNLQRKLSATGTQTESIQGSCTHCGLCCVDRSCVFLEWNDGVTSQCSIYDNWFWRLTSCGSYPIDGPSIAVYGCPSFKAIPIKVVKSGNTSPA